MLADADPWADADVPKGIFTGHLGNCLLGLEMRDDGVGSGDEGGYGTRKVSQR